MWKDNRKIKSLEDRIKTHEETLISNVNGEREKELIYDELRKTKLWNYDPVKIISFDYSPYTLNLSIYDIQVETVIEFFCGHLHRIFNIDWVMIPESNSIKLTSTHKSIRIVFEIYEQSMKACEIKKRVIKERTNEELDYFRFDYAYEINCE